MGKFFAIDPKATERYILRDQREDDQADQVVFYLKKTFTAREKAHIKDNAVVHGESGMSVQTGKQQLLALHMGLQRIENLNTEEGEAVLLDDVNGREKGKIHNLYKPIKDSVLDALPDWVRDELSAKLLGFLEDGGDEETLKNSQSSQESSQE